MLMIIILTLIGSLAPTVAPSNIEDQIDFIDQLNVQRRELAKRAGMINMHELNLDSKLMKKSENSPGRHKTWRFMFIDSFSTGVDDLMRVTGDFADAFAVKSKQEKNQTIVGVENGYLSELEHFTPGHTRIGCVELKQKNDIDCYLGPDGTMSSWATQPGKPGSNCIKGYKGVDGMCSPEAKFSQLTFIVNLNEARKDYAKGRVTNMHKLEYSTNLATKAQQLKKNDILWGEARKLWRFTLINSFETGTDELMKATNSHKPNYSKDENDIETNFLLPFEHLNKFQTSIGCAEHQKDGFEIICLLAPAKGFSELNGNCKKGYINIEGLCSLVPPTFYGIEPSSDDNSTEIPPTEYVHVWPTTVETELDRLIAKYKKEEKEGDLPSGDEVEEDGASAHFSAMVFLIFVFLVLV